MAVSCFILRLSFAVGLAVGAGVVIGGGSTGCVALALPSLSLATISSLNETLRWIAASSFTPVSTKFEIWLRSAEVGWIETTLAEMLFGVDLRNAVAWLGPSSIRITPSDGLIAHEAFLTAFDDKEIWCCAAVFVLDCWAELTHDF